MRITVTFVQIVRIPAGGVAAFQQYESLVLPIMPRYGGRLERRLCSADGQIEIHVVTFPSQDDLDRYLAESERAEHLHLRTESGASTELLEVVDVSG